VDIEYTLDESDLIRFAEHHLDHSPSVRRSRRILRYGLAFAFVIWAVFVTSISGTLRYSWIGLALAAVWVLALPPYLRWRYRQQLSWQFREGDNRALLGPQRLVLDADGLTLRTELMEASARWPAVQRVDSDAEHTFVYLTSNFGLIVPHRKVTRGDAAALAAEIARRREAQAGLSGA
jgi:hypothetical protein